tara:strand:- start:232 stop:453 length:222 start_codon:yes stop_codon:yes gene_type:complete
VVEHEVLALMVKSVLLVVVAQTATPEPAASEGLLIIHSKETTVETERLDFLVVEVVALVALALTVFRLVVTVE